MPDARAPAGGPAVLRLSGRIHAAGAAELEHQLGDLLAAGQTLVVLDLSEVTYVSSAFLRVLLSMARRARRQGGDLCLSGMPARVREVFDMAEFNGLFRCYESAEAACAQV